MDDEQDPMEGILGIECGTRNYIRLPGLYVRFAEITAISTIERSPTSSNHEWRFRLLLRGTSQWLPIEFTSLPLAQEAWVMVVNLLDR